MWRDDVKNFRAVFNYGDPDWVGTVDLKSRIKAHVTANLSAGLSRGLFNEVVTWKLEKQENRTRHHRQKITDDLVHKITGCAFSLAHPDQDTLARARLTVLHALPGVEMGVASAILALTFPNEYGVNRSPCLEGDLWSEEEERVHAAGLYEIS